MAGLILSNKVLSVQEVTYKIGNEQNGRVSDREEGTATVLEKSNTNP